MHDNQRSDRRSRSGSRHRRNRGGRDSRDSRGGSNGSSGGSSSFAARPQAPVKLSFWQKLASLFTGKPKTSSSPRPAPAQAPSQNGHRRFESATPRQARKPEMVEVSSPKIYVGNLSFDAVESDLFDLFNGVGQVQNAEVVSNKYTHKSKGFAFVTMLTVDEARRAVTELHDKEFMGRKLVVSGAKTSDRENPSRDRDPEPREESAPSTP
jgi:RNA recognition motif-containing protein